MSQDTPGSLTGLPDFHPGFVLSAEWNLQVNSNTWLKLSLYFQDQAIGNYATDGE